MTRPATATTTPRRRRRRRGAAGSLSLEAAMALPVVALCAVGLLQLVGVVRDALLAQDLARIGARVAATDPSDTAVERAVVDAAGDGVKAHVSVVPSQRHRGDTVTVTVVIRRPDRPFDLDLTGHAVVRGEPVLDTGGGP